MKSWDDLASEIESALQRFETEPYGDLATNAGRASLIATRIIKEQNGYSMDQPSFSKIKNNKFVQKLKFQIEENPIVVLIAAAAIITASAKLIDAVGRAKGSSAYAKQVNYRINKNK